MRDDFLGDAFGAVDRGNLIRQVGIGHDHIERLGKTMDACAGLCKREFEFGAVADPESKQ
jgi:hypothetical protein